MSIKRSIEKILKLPGPIPEDVPDCEALEFFACRGVGAFLRGMIWRLRFKSCGSLYVGARARIFFPSYISAGSGVFIGQDVMIQALSTQGVKFGDAVRIREHTWILATSELHRPGVGVEIGDGSYIGPYCYLGAGGGLTIGRSAVIGAHVHFLAENHKFADAARPIREQGVSRKGIRIGEDVWIGNQAIILDGVTVGDGCVVGAGAVVTRDVAPRSVVAGNPARVIKTRE